MSAATSLLDRPRFTSASGRTVLFLDPAGLQQVAEEHEWMRARIAALEVENASLHRLTGPKSRSRRSAAAA